MDIFHNFDFMRSFKYYIITADVQETFQCLPWSVSTACFLQVEISSSPGDSLFYNSAAPSAYKQENASWNEKPFRFHCNICGVNMNKHEWSPWFWAQTECCSALCFSCPGCACSLWPLWARSPCALEPHAASPFPSAEHGAACGCVPPLFPSPHGHSVLPSLPSPASKCTPLTPDVSFATARITKG